jgi:endonuclease YncB( thermonuclease family)
MATQSAARANSNQSASRGMDAPDKSCRGRRKGNCEIVLVNGIDATKSKRALVRLLSGQQVMVRYYKGTTYGRKIAVVCAGRINATQYMIDNWYASFKPTWNGAARRVRCD